MFPAPAMPTFPPSQSTTTTAYLRYEDITQDGHMIPIALPAALGGLWRDRLVGHPGSHAAMMQGIVPILTRLTLTSLDAPIRVDRQVESLLGFELAHDLQGDEVSRLYINIWCETRGIAGRGPGPHDPAAALVPAGTVFAEHVFTRLLAPPEQRKVTRLGVPGFPDVPPLRYAAPAPATAQELPAGASWLDDLADDPADYVFTLDQTDSNQHVNSLVYIRVFHDAINRRLAAAGRSLRQRSQAVDIAYRKPSFAGDRVRVSLRLFELAGAVGAAGSISGADGKIRCYVRVLLHQA